MNRCRNEDVYDNAKAKKSKILVNPSHEGHFCSMTKWLFLLMADVSLMIAGATCRFAPAFRPANMLDARYWFFQLDIKVTLLRGFTVGILQRFSSCGVSALPLWNLPVFLPTLEFNGREVVIRKVFISGSK